MRVNFGECVVCARSIVLPAIKNSNKKNGIGSKWDSSTKTKQKQTANTYYYDHQLV